MSRTTSAPLDDDVLNPKVAFSCFDFLLIELVPLIYRIVADLHAREEALMTEASRQHLFHGTAKANVASGGTAAGGDTKTLPDRTSMGAVSTSVDGGGGTVGGTSIGKGAATGAGTEGLMSGAAVDGVEDTESIREAVFFRLDAMGYRVGQGLAERFSADQPRPQTQLDSIKFVCKDLWTRVFRKPIDNLKTNHRGTFVLTDNRFQPLSRMSMDRKLGPRGVDQALHKAQAFLWFPCGIIRGALAGLGMQVSVQAETTDLPVATFQIRTVGAKP